MTEYRPGDVTKRLAITGAGLRVWTREFSQWLSETARANINSATGQPVQRRFTDDDLRVLLHVKALLSTGLTYAEVREQLAAGSLDKTAIEIPPATPDDVRLALAGLQAAVQAKDETIAAKDEAIEALREALSREQQRADRAERELDEQRAATRASGPAPSAGEQEQPRRRSWWQRLTGTD